MHTFLSLIHFDPIKRSQHNATNNGNTHDFTMNFHKSHRAWIRSSSNHGKRALIIYGRCGFTRSFRLRCDFYRISFLSDRKYEQGFPMNLYKYHFFLRIQMDIIVIIFWENRTHKRNIECKGKSIEISTRSDCNERIVKSWIELNAWELELNLFGL